MAETFTVRIEEVDSPRVRFRVEGRLRDRPEPFPLDARFAVRVIIDGYRAMKSSEVPGEDQPIDAAEIRRLVESHPSKILETLIMDPFRTDAKFVSSFAADFTTEVSVERTIRERDDGPYETTVFWLRVRDPKLLAHCVPGLHWTSSIAMTLT